MKHLFKLIPLILLPFLAGTLLPGYKSDPAISDLQYDVNPGHLDGPFTGGFGELTCHSCHFDYDINMDRGSLTVGGINNTYRPGKSYRITITVESEHLEIGGFQMTARLEDGTQAGSFEWSGNRLMLTPSISDTIQYLQHSKSGTSPTGEREVSWTFTWIAPVKPEGNIIFNIAANAGNNDDSAFDDWIYVKEKKVEPVVVK